MDDLENIVPYHTQYPLDDWFLCNLLLAVLTAELGDQEHALSLLRTALQSEDSVQVTASCALVLGVGGSVEPCLLIPLVGGSNRFYVLLRNASALL